MATVQSNLTLGQLGRCFARIARQSGELEINIRAAKQGDVRHKKGTDAYALDVPGYGLLICMPGSPPVPGDMSWQTSPAFLRAVHRAVEQWANAMKVAWPGGQYDARRDFGLSGWPPNPEEIEAGRRRQKTASESSEAAMTSAETGSVQVASTTGQTLVDTEVEVQPPEAQAQGITREAEESLGYGEIIMATDLAAGRYTVDENGLFIAA